MSGATYASHLSSETITASYTADTSPTVRKRTRSSSLLKAPEGQTPAFPEYHSGVALAFAFLLLNPISVLAWHGQRPEFQRRIATMTMATEHGHLLPQLQHHLSTPKFHVGFTRRSPNSYEMQEPNGLQHNLSNSLQLALRTSQDICPCILSSRISPPACSTSSMTTCSLWEAKSLSILGNSNPTSFRTSMIRFGYCNTSLFGTCSTTLSMHFHSRTLH